MREPHRTGTSVGEWLNRVVQSDDDDAGEPTALSDFDEAAEYRQELHQEVRREPYLEPRQELRQEPRQEPHQEPRREARQDQRREQRRLPRSDNRDRYRPRDATWDLSERSDNGAPPAGGEGAPYREIHRDHSASDEPPARREGAPYRDEPRRERDDYRPRERERDREREAARAREELREREAAQAREEARAREALREGERIQEEMREAARAREELREREAAQAREEARTREELRENERIQEETREAARARQEAARAREELRERARILEQQEREATRDELLKATAQTRNELGEVHTRLDRLSQQLERLAQPEAVPRPRVMPQSPAPQISAATSDERTPRLTGAPMPPPRRDLPEPQRNRPASLELPPAGDRRSRNGQDLSIEDAVAEITARQRALASGTAVASPPKPPVIAPVKAALPDASPPAAPEIVAAPKASTPIAPVVVPEPKPLPPARPASRATYDDRMAPPAINVASLEKHLREISARIEALRPANDLEKAITAVRSDLAEIGRLVTEALPRRAVESLEIEVKALAERIDHSRQSGVDSAALAGLERAVAEIREALRGLTTAENLVGFDEAVKTLAQKVDLIIAREDPAALQQLETAIGALRGIVSHVASNDALTKVAEDVRSLAGKVDGLAISAANGNDLSVLGTRIDTLASALTASTEAGHAVPRELEKLLAGLIEKLEWVQLTHTDHAALAHLEDRIAMLIKRFDASDARLGHLEAIERGLADLLVHIEQMRGMIARSEGGAKQAPAQTPATVEAIKRDVAEIKQSERRTQDSLDAVQDTVEHVVDRLATIESTIRPDAASRAMPAQLVPEQVLDAPPADSAPARQPPPPPAAPTVAPILTAVAPEPRRNAAGRAPIDPNLPPNHPLEPGSAGGRSRAPESAADRIAASEAAVGSAKPPVIPDPGNKPDFIAAARRAAQAAASAPTERQLNADAFGGVRARLPVKLPPLRKLLVAAGAVLIVIGCIHIASRLFQDGGSNPPLQTKPDTASPPPVVVPEVDSSKQPSAVPEPVPPEVPATPPGVPPAAAPAKPAKPGRQSMLQDGAEQSVAAAGAPPAYDNAINKRIPQWASPDITGSLPLSAIPQGASPASAPAAVSLSGKLPATIGGPALRAAAMSGDPAAAYEVAMRFAAGHGVAQNNEEAAHWLERAAKQGLAPAQFRLGGFYEKGIGVKKDLAAARDLYLAAAEKGNGKAMHNLAVLYAEGIDGPADYRDAAHWFRKAADHGITDSQYNLGILYARGIGVEQNYAESYKWFVARGERGRQGSSQKARRSGLPSRSANARGCTPCGADLVARAAARRRDRRQAAGRRLGQPRERGAGGEIETAAGRRQGYRARLEISTDSIQSARHFAAATA